MIDVATLFPDGKLPPLPQMEISKLTAKFLTQEQVDMVMSRVSEERPDFILAVIEEDINKGNDLSDLMDSFRSYILRNISEDFTSIKGTQLFKELKDRTRRLLNLPATYDEVMATSARGEVVR